MGVARSMIPKPRIASEPNREADIIEAPTTCKILVTAKIENHEDLYSAKKGLLTDDHVRRIEVHDALVDAGVSMHLLPKRMVAALGLKPLRTRHSRGPAGDFLLPMYGTVRLTIQGRDCAIDVGEISDEYPVRVGRIPLASLDWVIDPMGQRLIGNPDHGGEWGIDAF